MNPGSDRSLAEPLRPDQRTADGSTLEAHWESYSAKHYRELSALVLNLAYRAPDGVANEKTKVCVINYPCSSGALFRALRYYLSHKLDISFIGVDADRRTLDFVRAKFPSAALYEADSSRLRELVQQREAGITADIAVIISLFYSLRDSEARTILDAMSRVAPRIIIADQIDNFSGSKPSVLELRDSYDRPYEAYCHSFKQLLRQAGYVNSVALPAKEPVKSLTGYLIAEIEKSSGGQLIGIGDALGAAQLSKMEQEARLAMIEGRAGDVLASSNDPLIPPPAINFNQRASLSIEEYERTYKQSACLKEFPFLMRRAELRPSAKILDYGCGLGRHAYAASKFLSVDGRYFGFEINPHAIRFLRAAYRDKPNFAFKGETLAYEDDYIAMEYKERHGSSVRAISIVI